MQILDFLFIGLGTGALYVIAGLGLIVVHRGSGVINFAHGAIGTVGAYLFWSLHVNDHLSFVPAYLVSMLVCAVIGGLTHNGLIRPLRHSSVLTKLLVTLGLLITLDSIVSLIYPQSSVILPSSLPTTRIVVGGVVIGLDKLILFIIAIVLTVVLWWFYRYSRFGIATTAAAHSHKIAASLGYSANVIATVNWIIGSVLAGTAAVLLAPITGLQVTQLTELVIPALAVAVIGGLRSFPLALLAGLALGVAQSEVSNYVSYSGVATALPLVLVIVLLTVRGSRLPGRLDEQLGLPKVGMAKLRPVSVAALLAVGVALIAVVPVPWVYATTTTLIYATILLSVVVITGYAGQLSLAQFAIAGVGAYVAGEMAASLGWPFLASLITGVIAAAVAGALLALPALRTRGVTLSISTLAFAAAVEALLFDNSSLTGGYAGLNVGTPTIFGLDISSVFHPRTYAYVCLAGFAIAAVAVTVLHGRPSGRRLLAIRANERAATALGVRVARSKIFAFALGGAITALGGILLVFRDQFILYTNFQALDSVNLIGLATVGGVGYPSGSVWGAQLQPGAWGAQLGDTIFGQGFAQWLTLATGVIFLVMLLQSPHGMAERAATQIAWVRGKVGALLSRRRDLAPAAPRADHAAVVEPAAAPAAERLTLRTAGLSVSFGPVNVLHDVSVTAPAGEITGLIGPNGAGKSTFIDTMGGFVQPRAGTIMLNEADITSASPATRARQGLGRSFQSLELFDDMTVRGNLQVASEAVASRRDSATARAWLEVAVSMFGLGGYLDRQPTELPYGRRRLVAIARAVAAGPGILLLDEPAAGLTAVEVDDLGNGIRELARLAGVGILLVEHNVDLIMRACDSVYVLNFGRVIAHGSPEEVRNDPDVVAAYLGTSDARLPVLGHSAEDVPVAGVAVSAGAGDHGGSRPAPRGRPVPAAAGARNREVPAVIAARDLSLGYGQFPAVRGVNLEVRRGEMVSIFGANGAGKTTTLLGLAGWLRPSSGAVSILGETSTARMHQRARGGLAFVPEESGVIPNLSVRDNYRLSRSGGAVAYAPELERITARKGGLLSGGERQILALTRAISRNPQLIMIDELSLGLAPMIVTRLFEMLRVAADHGTAVLVVEQQVETALRYVDWGYVLKDGTVTMEGPAATLVERRAELEANYLSV
ncbi:MAG: amino acid/amide transporter rane protein 2, family / amino acid/amide transporter [Actinomycetia bacterium]|nr:amino acid/amide transporter rane protein 2, family / amino acid/amide transporter [Actinomycetes bacterium]